MPHSDAPRPAAVPLAPAGPARSGGARPTGVYVHFPYCLRKCPYCDFVSYARPAAEIDHQGYADAVVAELDRRRSALEDARLETIFFGGGTPSLWEPGALGRVVSAILAWTDPARPVSAEDVEITVECNPTSLTPERARALAGLGVNRLSVGVQSLDEERLRFLGRWHTPDEALRSIEGALRSGVERVSADLIFGVAGGRAQRPEVAAAEATRLAATGVTHVSAYGLTIEPGTAFGERARAGQLPIARDDDVVESFFAIHDALADRGLSHYEISNYARPGDEARHNLGTWRGQDYLGLGAAAVGAIGGRRYRNRTQPHVYVERAASDDVEESAEVLDPETKLRERIMLGLRLAEGLDTGRAARELGVLVWTRDRRGAADRLIAEGLLSEDADRIRIPPAKWMLADGIIARLF